MKGKSSTGFLDVSSRKQLFIDDLFIENSAGISLTVNRPVKDARPCLVPDRPWEAKTLNGFASVTHDGDSYRLWYVALADDSKGAAKGQKIPLGEAGKGQYRNYSRLCYAESTDGASWQKPELGLVIFRGSTRNNIVMTHDDAVGDLNPVYLDTNPDCPREQRYKTFWLRIVPVTGNELIVNVSPDGHSWQPLSGEVSYGRTDTNNVLFWDDRIGRYVAMVRGLSGQSAWRVVSRCEFDDMRDWGPSQVVLKADEHDAPETDVYNSAAVKYEDVYLMFPSFYCHFPEPPEGEYHNDGVLDIQFAVSRDGVDWKRPERWPFVALGADGEWDSRQMYMASGLITTASEVYLYYTGFNYTHAEDDYIDTAGYAGGINRVRLRRDGFMSADAGVAEGELTTVPLVFDGSRLELNVQTSVTGSLKAEILGEDGKALPGYSLDECRAIKGNFIRTVLSWKSGDDVSALQGRPIRLRFVMRHAKLYAFQFCSD